MRIDVHCHYNPPAYFTALVASGAEQDLSIWAILGHLWKTDDTAIKAERGSDRAALERRLADMDAAGVDRQIMSIGAVHPYLADAGAAARCCTVLNDAYADFTAMAPDRLSAFAALPLPHVDEAIAEVSRSLDQEAFLGIALGASAQGIPIDDDRFAALWEELDRRRAIVYVHPGAEIGGVPGCREFHLAPDFVSPAEVAVCAGRLLTRGILDRYPNVTFVLATFGGSLPFLARRFDRGLAQDEPALHEQMGGVLSHLRRFYVDTSVVEEPILLGAARETFGADRLVLGSDYARPGVRSTAAIEFIESSTYLTDEEKDAVLQTNAMRLFGLTVEAGHPG